MVTLVRHRDLCLLVCDLFGVCNHYLGSLSFCIAFCDGDSNAGNQTVAVVPQDVAHVV
jgi:hypothetical protein